MMNIDITVQVRDTTSCTVINSYSHSGTDCTEAKKKNNLYMMINGRAKNSFAPKKKKRKIM